MGRGLARQLEPAEVAALGDVAARDEGATACGESAAAVEAQRESQAQLVAEDAHRTIQLLFTPNGPGNACAPSSLAPKANVCVGCGASDASALVRWSVVPHSFRRLLPAKMKSRDSHDIVLLCRGCYAACEGAYEAHRAAEFRAAGIARDTRRYEPPPAHEARVRSAAAALSAHERGRVVLPAGRRAELEACLVEAEPVECFASLADVGFLGPAGVAKGALEKWVRSCASGWCFDTGPEEFVDVLLCNLPRSCANIFDAVELGDLAFLLLVSAEKDADAGRETLVAFGVPSRDRLLDAREVHEMGLGARRAVADINT